MHIENLLSEGIKATPPSFVRGILKAASDPSVISFAGGAFGIYGACCKNIRE